MEKPKKCISCDLFKPIYTKAETGFKKESLGYCKYRLQVTDGKQICHHWEENICGSYSMVWDEARILRGLLFRLSEINQQLQEMENESKS